MSRATAAGRMARPAADALERRLGLAAALLLAGALMGALGWLRQPLPWRIDVFLFQRQDTGVLALAGVALLGFRAWRGAGWALPAAGWPLAAAVLGTAIVAAAGTALVTHGYGLSADEFMAWFDGRILESGRLLAPVDPASRPLVPALQPNFLRSPGDHSVWASSYLPVNAAIRTLFDLAGAVWLAGPALAALSVVAIWAIAGRLWPGRPDARLVAVALLAGAAQVTITAMTPYAMTAHLALNLAWLWLFLRDRPGSHAAALAVGFAATGLHQLAFHLAFAAPFVLSLWLGRRWRPAAFYTAGYAAIGLFWIAYPAIALALSGAAPEAGGAGAGASFIGTVAGLLAISADGFATMLRNLFRFLAWQHPLLLPLLIAGLAGLGAAPRTLRPLAGGIGLTLLLVLLMMPYQGHGWGYRYLHGLIGSVSLIAVQGWVSLTEDAARRRRAGALLAGGTALAVLVLLPVRALQVEAFIRPYAAASATIAATDADTVLVDAAGIWFGVDLARNDPWLRNRPRVLVLSRLDEPQLRAACAGGRVALFDAADAAALGLRTGGPTPAGASDEARRALLDSLGCG